MKYLILSLLIAFSFTCEAKSFKATPKPTPNVEVVELKSQVLTQSDIIEAIRKDALATKEAFAGILAENVKLKTNADLMTVKFDEQAATISTLQKATEKLQASYDAAHKEIVKLKDTVKQLLIKLSHYASFTHIIGIICGIFVGFTLFAGAIKLFGAMPNPIFSIVIPIALGVGSCIATVIAISTYAAHLA